MFAWYVGCKMRKAFESDLRVVRKKLTPCDRMMVARRLRQVMDEVAETEASSGRRKAVVLSFLQALVQQAQADRHAALAGGARNKSDPEWCAASLAELWAVSKLDEELRKISLGTFHRIDEAAFNFVLETLGSEEIAG
jgi:hypothetical protein